ncbi:hypothetical protein D7D52_37105 [Nocardia yunnanensis]|uniref:Uncharacterized protein n=2 Tax=Nocardia yunnanensis TaxID=2382165 RepID=A0A386ZMU1_9NOCA|nr:hypothetical protein D7D52_37105 [Nocardia yunnanensis]
MAERGWIDTKPVTAQMTLRAPRVALVIPAGPDWHLAARRALHAASQVWGGAGFVVVPYEDDGTVHATLLAAVREYDPDYVLRLREDLVGSNEQGNSDAGEVARQAISARCSDYRTATAASIAVPGLGDSRLSFFDAGGASLLTAVASFGEMVSSASVGAASGLNDCLGVAAASTWGQADQPIATDTSDGDEKIRRRAVYAILAGTPPNNIRGVTNLECDDSNLWSDFARTSIGLEAWSLLGPGPTPVLMVWGGSAADFALAMSWDRTYGQGTWIPDSWWSTALMQESVALGLQRVVQRAGDIGRQIVVTSMSLDLDRVQSLLSEVTARIAQAYPGGRAGEGDLSQFRVVAPQSLEFGRSNKWQYTVQGQYATQWSETVTDDGGSLEWETLPPIPAVDLTELRAVKRLSWQVEMSLPEHDIPGTRAVATSALLRRGEPLR